MRKYMRLTALCVSLIIIMEAGGCMNWNNSKKTGGNSDYDPLAYENQLTYVLDYLRGRYDEEFEYVSRLGGTWGSAIQEYIVRPAGCEDKAFGVSLWLRNDEKKGEVTDGYYHIAVRDEYIKFVETTVRKVFPECKTLLSMDLTFCPSSELVKGVSLQDAYDMGLPYNPKGDIDIMVKKDDLLDYKLLYDKILETLNLTLEIISVTIYVLPDELYNMFGNEQRNGIKITFSGAMYYYGANINFSELHDHENEFTIFERIGESWK